MPEVPVKPQETTQAPKSHDWIKTSLTVLIILVVGGLAVAAYWNFFIHKSSTIPVLNAPVQTETKTATESAVVKDDVWKSFEQQSKVSVTISLNAPPIPTDKDKFTEYKKEIKLIQDRVLNLLKPDDFDLIYQWEVIPGLVGQITKNGLDDLKNSGDVSSIVLNKPTRINLY